MEGELLENTDSIETELLNCDSVIRVCESSNEKYEGEAKNDGLPDRKEYGHFVFNETGEIVGVAIACP